MSNLIYSQRMSELDTRKVEAARRQFPDLSRPSPIRGNARDLNGNLAPSQEAPEGEADMESAFGMAFGHYGGQDSRFGQMMDDFQGLVSNLREQVKSGYMPEPIAQDRIRQFVSDGSQYFSNHNATPMDNPEVAGMVEGMLAQQMQAQQEPQVEESGLPNQQMPPQQMPPQQGGMPQQAPQMPQGGM
ncbi:MAG: hypothetical protein ACRC6V_00580 [Bacteroidales bacterium]